jgi:hypothetical protein
MPLLCWSANELFVRAAWKSRGWMHVAAWLRVMLVAVAAVAAVVAVAAAAVVALAVAVVVVVAFLP